LTNPWPTAFPSTLPGPLHLSDRWRQLRAVMRAAYDWGPKEPWGRLGAATITMPLRVAFADHVEIGDGVVIEHDVWLSLVRPFDDVEPKLVLEDGVRIGRGSSYAVAGEMVFERGAVIGAFSLIADTFHPYDVEDRLPHSVRPDPVRIGAGAVLGQQVIVLPGVTIGAGAVIEHNAVVGKDVPPGAVVAGYPARRRRDFPVAEETPG